MREQLDEQGNAIASLQETSVESRKSLANKTKAFRKSLEPELFKKFSPLLKSYQEEIDALTSRAKTGEKAFLDLYQNLYEAPDPSGLLAENLRLTSRATELETQAAKFAAELAEYKAESKLLKNQDGTIRRLEEKVHSLEAEVAAKDAEIEAARDEAAVQLQSRLIEDSRERELRLEAELERAHAAHEAVRRMHQATQSQLFSVQERGEEAAAAARAEAEFVAMEVERAQEQLVLLTKERDELLKQINEQQFEIEEGSKINVEQANEVEDEIDNEEDQTPRRKNRRFTKPKAPSGSVVASHVATIREELRTQRELAARTESELRTAVKKAEAECASALSRLESTSAQLQASNSRIEALEAELIMRPTIKEFEDARERIRVLSAVFYNSLGDNEESEGFEKDMAEIKQQKEVIEGAENFNISGIESNKAVTSLESALLAKNRHLEHMLTMSRLEAAEAATASENSAAKIIELETELNRQNSLIAKLEEDLIAAEEAVGLGSHRNRHTLEEKSLSRNSTKEEEVDVNQSGEILESTSSDLVEKKSDLNSSNSNQRDIEDTGEATLLSILTGQRDRLRARVTELETELIETKHKLTSTKKEVEAVRADNLALMERLKFIQGYTVSSSGQKNERDIETGNGALNRWNKEYEDKVVNPLNDFRRREREARRKAMPLQDRAAVAVGSALVSGGRLTKSMIIVYAFALHLMAFIVLAGFSHRHADRLDQLEELCAGIHGLANSNLSGNDKLAALDAGAVSLP